MAAHVASNNPLCIEQENTFFAVFPLNDVFSYLF